MRYRKIDSSNRVDEWQAMNKAIITLMILFLLIGVWAFSSKWINSVASIIPFSIALCCWWLFENNFEREN